MIASSRNYAIGMVHFRIGGGWLVTGIVLGVYLLGFFGLMAIIYYVDYRNGGRVVLDVGKVLLGFLMALQGLALLGFGGYRVSSAIRTDVSSRMLESHRLMPISSARAVMGYLFGPPTPAVAFVLLNLFLSLIFGNWLGGSLDRLVLNQTVVIGFAVFVWSSLCLGTFIYRHMFIICFSAMLLGLCTGLVTGAYMVLPGFSLLITPFLGESVFNVAAPMGAGVAPPYELYAIGLGAQAVLFLLFFLASCRLYRGTYATAFNTAQALALLLTWAILSALGISHSDQLGLQHLFGAGREEFNNTVGLVQICGSVAACLLVGMIPLWSVLKDPPVRRGETLAHGLVVPVVALLVTIPVGGALWMPAFGARAIAITFLVVLTQIVVIYCLLRLVRRLVFILAALIIVGVLFALNLAPLILEMVRLNFFRGDDQTSVLVTLSPLGLVAAEWSHGIDATMTELSPALGCLWQVLVAGIALSVVYLITRRPSRVPSHAPALTPVQSAPSSGAAGPG